MNANEALVLGKNDPSYDEFVFESISNDIYQTGYSIKPLALPYELATSLQHYCNSLDEAEFNTAGIGRAGHFTLNQMVRTDSIHWIDGKNHTELAWLNWMDGLKRHLNRRLFLGLFSYESHFASYLPGQFYKRHLDAFKGKSNRVVTTVVYLNDDWQITDGGELVIYKNKRDKEGIKVMPSFGTIVTFLSEEFPHEVLPATRQRLSIAGWFSINKSLSGVIDPPR